MDSLFKATNILIHQKLNLAWEKMLGTGVVFCGYMDGGCLTYAKAYQALCKKYFNKNVKTSLQSMKSSDGVVQHFVVHNISPNGEFYFDADGMQKLEPLIEKMARFENCIIDRIDTTTKEDIEASEALKFSDLVDLLVALVELQMPSATAASGRSIDAVDLRLQDEGYVLTYQTESELLRSNSEITL